MSNPTGDSLNNACDKSATIACLMVELALREIAHEIGKSCNWNPVMTSNDLSSAIESVADRISTKLKESSEKPQSWDHVHR